MSLVRLLKNNKGYESHKCNTSNIEHILNLIIFDLYDTSYRTENTFITTWLNHSKLRRQHDGK